MTKLGMKCLQKITCFQFTLDWLQLHRELFVFSSIFSFYFLGNLPYEQFSQEDNNVGSFSMHSFVDTFIFHVNNFPLTRFRRMCFWAGKIFMYDPCIIPFHSNTYILLDVLLCSNAEYFYELCHILASP